MRIMITGANGFVAHYLIQMLLKKGVTVLATGKGRKRIGIEHPLLQYTELDFTEEEATGKFIEAAKPDLIIHTGALSKPDECEQNREEAYRINVGGTINLLRAGAAVNAGFCFLSTDFVFDGSRGMYREEDERGSVNYYGSTKIMAEDEVMRYSGPWSIVRTVLVYGHAVSSRPNLLTHVAASLKEGKELKIFSDQFRTPTYVEDLARAIVQIVLQKRGGIFHISGKDGMSPYDMAVAVADHLSLDRSLITDVTESEFDQPARRPLRTGFVLDKSRNILGYEPLSFEEGLKKTLSNPSS